MIRVNILSWFATTRSQHRRDKSVLRKDSVCMQFTNGTGWIMVTIWNKIFETRGNKYNCKLVVGCGKVGECIVLSRKPGYNGRKWKMYLSNSNWYFQQTRSSSDFSSWSVGEGGSGFFLGVCVSWTESAPLLVGGYFCRSKLEYETKIKFLVVLSASQRPHQLHYHPGLIKSISQIYELFKIVAKFLSCLSSQTVCLCGGLFNTK